MSTFEREYKRLNDRQRQAVETIDGPIVVIAGPGTGKTQLLSLRVANILQKTDAQASNVLCLTFTESGQQAMQRRLLEIIGPEASHVNIHTFHGLGSYLISSNPEAFPHLADFRAADDLTLFEILHSIFEELPYGNPLAAQNGNQYVFLKDAKERISQLKQAGITPEQLRTLIELDGQWCKAANKHVEVFFNKFPRLSKKQIYVFEELAQQLMTIKSKKLPLDWLQPLGNTCLNQLQTAIQEATDTSSTSPLTVWKRIWTISTNGQFALKAQTQHKRLEILANIYENYQTGLREKRLFDYDDMIIEVLVKMEADPDFLASLQERYQYILVDEYQDTNAAQARLLELLADSPVHEGRPNILVVGDDDQAIYGFQGAEQGVFLRFRERWRDVKVLTLNDNYRSSQSILDAARQVIVQGNTRLENHYPDISKLLQAHAGHAEKPPVLYSFGLEAEQYEWLVGQLKKLKAASVPLKEIAIFAPRHKYLQKLVPKLIEADIPLQYERRANVLDEPAMQEFICLARAVNYLANHEVPEADALLPELFTFKWWDVPPSAVASISATRQTSNLLFKDLLSAKDNPLQPIAKWLQKTAKSVHALPVDKALGQLLGPVENQADYVSPIRKYYMNTLEFQALKAGLRVIVHNAQEYYNKENINLYDLVSYVDLCERAGVAIVDNTEVATSKSAVHVMTAYKSKGLEFDIVFILHADETVWLKERGMINKISLPPNLLIQPAGETSDDRLRVFYVGITRARKQLYFSRHDQYDSGKRAQPLSWLAHASLEGLITSSSPPVITSNKIEKILPMQTNWRSAYYQQSDLAQIKKTLKPILKQYRLSPSHLTTFLDIVYYGPLYLFAHHLLRLPVSISPSAHFGSAIHDTLDYAQRQINDGHAPPTIATLEKYFQSQLNQYPLKALDVQKLLERGKRALRAYWAASKDNFSPGQLPEYNFKNDQIVIHDTPVTGKIDKLIIQDTKAIVVDYKTGKAFARWQGSSDYDKLKLHKYSQQLMFYKLLTENSPAFQKIDVSSATIEFIEPNREGEIVALPYVFEPHELERTKLLIKLVWDKITSLDLPDVSAYPKTYEGVLAFEQDLLDRKI